ncbi:nitric oxide synthase, inducible-like [Oscarella lobularis]|uniref:nitric oxide synthase, inducible-like n=1 Tax=Oscarella lobularis TaxID=121494 RepID=UPI0033139241
MPARPADPGDVANARKDNESQKQSIGNGIAADSMTTTSIGGVVNLSCHGANVGLTLDRRTFKITSIEPSSAAGKSDLVHVGDVVLRVNGHCTAALEYERVVDLLANVAAGRIDLKIMRNVPKAEPATSLEYNIPPLWVESDHRHNHGEMNGQAPSASGGGGGGGRMPRRAMSLANDGRPGSPLARRSYVQLKNWSTEKRMTDTLHSRVKSVHDTWCNPNHCQGSIMYPLGAEVKRLPGESRSKDDVIDQAEAFLSEYFQSLKKRSDSQSTKKKLEEMEAKRMREVVAEVELKGTYELDEKELVFGAKLAWRNSPRCIGRIQWNKLQVFDCRHISSGEEMEQAIRHHIKFATNGGNIRSAITVFPQRTSKRDDFRIWSPQYFRYAGYKMEDGTILGDPATVDFTEIVIGLGWKPPEEKTMFDLMPIVIQAPREKPRLVDVSDLILEVEVWHPQYPFMKDLGLKWYGLPAVSNMMFDVGGLEFPASPFNGWYMAPEVAARNFGDTYRFNMLEPVAKGMGLDTSSLSTLWKDKALVELNVAVLHSFQEAKVTINDHHSAAASFMQHLEKEVSLRGGCPADWVWIVPPLSGSATPVFHQEMLNYKMKPSFEYQEAAWLTQRSIDKQAKKQKKRGIKTLVSAARVVMMSMQLFQHQLMKRVRVTILYATETGKSERYAKDVASLFSHAFAVKVVCMEDYTFSDIEYEQLLLTVTSTFGNGDPPDNGEVFGRELYEMRHPPPLEEENKNKRKISSIHLAMSSKHYQGNRDDSQPLANVRFSVFGLGSRAYPNFCAFARSVDRLLGELGAERVYEKGEGDELCGQEESFRKWVTGCYEAACKTFFLDTNLKDYSDALSTSSKEWQPDKFRVSVQTGKVPVTDLCKNLSDLHKKNVYPCRMLSRTNLQNEESPRSTILVKVDIQNEPMLVHEPGDHLAIFPQNQPSLVNQLIKHLIDATPPDEPVLVEYNKGKKGDDWKPFERLPPGCTLRQALQQYLDITTPPAPQFLAILATLTADPKEKEKLLELSKGTTAYEDWKFDKCPNMVEVLEEFSSLEVPTSLFLAKLPLLQSRYYSISSSREYVGGEIHCTVAVVSFRTQGGSGSLHHGVCSSWLNRITKNTIVPCFVRKASSFYLPESKKSPVLMVGPGTGIAPFRSFWQQRKIEMELKFTVQSSGKLDAIAEDQEGPMWGDMALFFGCRHPKLDHIYKKDMEELVNEGVLAKVGCAYSRDPNQPKQYVQDQLKQEGEYIMRKLRKENGHFYVCGDVSMAADVGKTLEVIFEQHGGMSSTEARATVEKMRAMGHYHEDIFGVTLRTAEVTDRVRNAAKKAWKIIADASGQEEVSMPEMKPMMKTSKKKLMGLERGHSGTRPKLPVRSTSKDVPDETKNSESEPPSSESNGSDGKRSKPRPPLQRREKTLKEEPEDLSSQS